MEKSTQFFLFGVAITISISLSIFVYIISQRSVPKFSPKFEITVQESLKKDKIETENKPAQLI